MNHDHWEQIERIFQSAMELKGERRQAYLEEACAKDDLLRQEVESLLAHDGESAAGDPFQETAMQAAARILASEQGSRTLTDLSGQTLANFHILKKIGQGGMGVVYRAQDTRLHRDVALKVLPDSFAADADRKSRFAREARLLAGVNAPNIAAIYEFQETEGKPFLAMEMVEGPTLADRLRKSPLPLDEVLDIGRQIAEGLEAAHQRGIVHRDLKPANIKLTPKGQVKILDFGLAKAYGEPAEGDGPAESPTGTEHSTASGIILGTPAYMSPEQARGKAIDRRTDIWAFGCVLYELLTGRPAFAGPTQSDTLSSILTGEPDWSALPAATPAPLQRLLRRCLQKDPQKRLGAMCDAGLELMDAATSPATTHNVGMGVPFSKRTVWLCLSLVTVTAFLGGILSTKYLTGPKTPVSLAPIQTGIALSDDNSLTLEGGVSISPDGSTIAFSARSEKGLHLNLRRLDNWEPQLVSGTEMARSPTFSPDGRWIAFVRNRKLERISLAGGPPQTISQEDGFYGSRWEGSEHLIFGRWPQVGLWRVSTQEGALQLIVKLEEGRATRYLWPESLPDNKGILFTLLQSGRTSIALLPAGTEKPRLLIESGCFPRYLPTGHLLYLSGHRLYAVAFDLEQLKILGGAVAVVEDIYEDPLSSPYYDVSDNGTLIFARASMQNYDLVWKDRQGKTVSVLVHANQLEWPSLSPDRDKYSVGIKEGYSRNIWIGNTSGGPLTRLTFGNDDWYGVWSQGGRHLFYLTGQSGTYNIFRIAVQGNGPPERMTQSPNPQNGTSVSQDGNILLYNDIDPVTKCDIWELSLSTGKKRPLVQTPFDEGAAAFSPDGRWIAYNSSESGQTEVYIQTYPGLGLKKRVSFAGGRNPFWSHSGRELFYRDSSALYSVPILGSQDLKLGTPRLLFNLPLSSDYGNNCISPDDQRFLMIEQVVKFQQLNLVQNWFGVLERLVPTRKK